MNASSIVTQNIVRMEEIQEAALADLAVRLEGGCVEYVVSQGRCWGNSIHETKDVCIQVAWLDAETIFGKHQHTDKWEHLVVVTGAALLLLYQKDEVIQIPLDPGRVGMVPPNTLHDFVALTDVEVVGITIPPEEGYPHEST